MPYRALFNTLLLILISFSFIYCVFKVICHIFVKFISFATLVEDFWVLSNILRFCLIFEGLYSLSGLCVVCRGFLLSFWGFVKSVWAL